MYFNSWSPVGGYGIFKRESYDGGHWEWDVRVALPQFPLSPDFLCVSENVRGQLPATTFSPLSWTLSLWNREPKGTLPSVAFGHGFIIATHPQHCHQKDIKEKMKEGKPQTGAARAFKVCDSLNEMGKWCLLLKHTSSLLSTKPSSENSRNHRLTTGTGGLLPPLYRGSQNSCVTILLEPLTRPTPPSHCGGGLLR